MKNSLILAFVLFTISSFAQPANSINQDDNKAKIKIVQVLKAETSDFYANDYEAWKSNWSQSENSVTAWNNLDGTYRYIRGWSEINKVYKEMITNQTEESHPDFNVGNLNIDINGNLAYVVYDEYVANSDNKFSKVPVVKTLKKVNGQWKLHSVISYWDRNYQYKKEEVKEFIAGNGFDQYK